MAFSSVAAVALLCAACSTIDAGDHDKPAASSSSPSTGSVVRAAVAALRANRAEFRQEYELESEGQEYGLTSTGGFDFAADKGHLAVELPGGATDHSEQVFADGKIHISGVQGIGEGSWGVMPRDKAEAHYLLRAPLNDPEHLLQQIAAMHNVSREGEENVQGAHAVRYGGVLDHRTVTLRMARDVRMRMDQVRDALGSDVPVFADVWIDDRGRLVQIRMSVNMSGTGVTLLMALSDIGQPVGVTVPRASGTVPVTEVSGILNG